MQKRHFILYSLLLISFVSVWADDITFKANAPSTVVAGRQFQLTYTINSQSKDLRAPEFTNFDVLAGPFTSSSQSVSWINGQHTSTYEQTYTYTLVANKEGEYTIQPATISANGKTYTSNGLKIKVLPPDSNTQPSNTQPQRSQASGGSSNISSENLFVRTIVNKTRVHEQECLLISYRLYTLVDVIQLTGNTKIPDFDGFIKQEIDLGNNNQLELEHYNGRNYQAITLYQALLYPQHSGDIEIPQAKFEAIVRVRNQAQVRSIFDSFFDTYTNVSKQLTAAGTTIHAQALPGGKPSSFLGGVGTFDLASSINSNNIKTNDAITLTLEIKGTGNIKLIKTPSVDFPEGFELYDPKITNNVKTTTQGVSGTKKIEYLAIARNNGDFTIPPIEMSYFDTKEKTYKTLRTPAYNIHVEKSADDNNSQQSNVFVANKEDIKSLNSDIRYINTNPLKVQKQESIRIGSLTFWLLYLVPLLISIVLFIIFRKQIRDNADIRKVRYRKANKEVQKRLKTARKYMQANDKAHFYDEILKASWTYLSDKLSIPTSELNKENVADALRSHNATDELIAQFKDVLSATEFAQYAPAQSEHDMEDIYNKTSDMIENMEKIIK